ncbi:MAG: gliding motility-associated C-terminal domain-containing protein [Bacteroidales bacterium]
MKNLRYIFPVVLLATLILQGTIPCHSQILAPVLTNVTVNNSSSSASLTWTASPSAGVAGYVVYRYRNDEGYAIDTLWNPATLSYTDNSTGALFFSEAYVVSAIDNELNISPLSNSLSTIFLTAVLDTCNNRIDISWSEYNPVGTEVTEYEIYVSAEGGDFIRIHSAAPATPAFVWTGFELSQSYVIMVKAVMDDNSVSLSNRVSVITDIKQPPGWLQISNVTVNSSDQTEVLVSYDPLSELDLFRIVRREDDGNYAPVTTVNSTGGSFIFTDDQAITTRRYTYIAEVLNNCGTALLSSLPAGNIVLSYEVSDYTLLLNWNHYTGWAEGVDEYLLQYHTGDGSFRELARLSPADSSYIADFRSLMYEITGSETCFRLTAISTIADGVIHQAGSNRVCIEAPDSFFMPNAFTPDDNGINDYFGPVMAFTPSEFLLIIRDRNGRVVFSTGRYSDQWDGTWRGEKLPPDVYLWFLRIRTPSGKMTERTGTVALIYNN